MQPITMGSEDRGVEDGWFTRTVPVRRHKAESPMKKADVLVRLTLGVVALVGTKLDKTGFSRTWLSSSGSAIQ